MKIFHLTSTSFTGYIEFRFRDNGLLEKYEILADLTESQQIYLLRNLPREIFELDRFKSSTATVTEVSDEVTFDMFWDRYDDKINSSRKRALQKWNKMTPADQIRAFRFISRYFGSIPSGTRKKFAETYLNAELWNN